MTYRLITDSNLGDPGCFTIATRESLFDAMSVYLDACIDRPEAHVYLQEQEPATMLNRGWLLVRSSKIDRAA